MASSAVQMTAAMCSRRGCVLPCDTQPPYHVLLCARPGCGRSMHLLCCQKFVYGKYNLDAIAGPIGQHAVVCTKKCYDKVSPTRFSSFPASTTVATASATVATTATTVATTSNMAAPPVLDGSSVRPESRIPWNKDGKNGPDDPIHSESILIEWLCKPGNYEGSVAEPAITDYVRISLLDISPL